MTIKVLLDTNMLMMVAEQRIDIFSQIQELLQGKIDFIAPKMVLEELSKIAQEKTRRGKHARLALELAKKCKLDMTDPAKAEATDEYLANLAREMKGVVATGDTDLRRRLRNANIPVIYVRRGSRLAVEGIEPSYR